MVGNNNMQPVDHGTLHNTRGNRRYHNPVWEFGDGVLNHSGDLSVHADGVVPSSNRSDVDRLDSRRLNTMNKTSITVMSFIACAAVWTFAAAQAADPSDSGALIAKGASLDAHTHLISQNLLDGLTGGGIPSAGADDLIAQLDAAHIDKAVVLALGYDPSLDDSGSAAENDFAAAEIEKYPARLIGFCGINPLNDGALKEIDRCLSHDGMLGIKLQGSDYDWEDSDHASAISAVLNKAGEKDAPVLLHVNGPPLDAKAATNVLETLGANQTTRITIAHAGGVLDSEIELYLATQYLVPPLLNPQNLYMDLSASLKFYQDAPLSKRQLMVWRFRKWGIDKLFFGSDYLNAAPQQTPLDALETLTHYPFTQEELDTILSNDGSAWLYGN
jgi:predicted TIM-barrel fold metal-dependent hydrolase